MILTERIPGKVLIPVIFSVFSLLLISSPFPLIPFVPATGQIGDYMAYFSIFLSIVLGIAGMIFGIKYFKIYKRPLHRVFTITGLTLGAIISLLLIGFVTLIGYQWVEILIDRLHIAI